MLSHVTLSVLSSDEIGIQYDQLSHGGGEVDVYLYAMVGCQHISDREPEHLKRMKHVFTKL